MKELSVGKRVVVPILSMIASIFMIVAAIYAHTWGVMYFLIVTLVIMIIGDRVNKKNKERKKKNA